MLPLIVWLAGSVFGLWVIWHFGFYREAMAFAVCASVMLWFVGGLAWIGKHLEVARRSVPRGSVPDSPLARLTPNDVERAALKRSAQSASSEQST